MIRRNHDIDRRRRVLHEGTRGEGPVVCWLERDLRAVDNWALLYGQQEALIRNRGLIVVYCYDPENSSVSARQYPFLLKGLQELKDELLERNIEFVFVFENGFTVFTTIFKRAMHILHI